MTSQRAPSLRWGRRRQERVSSTLVSGQWKEEDVDRRDGASHGHGHSPVSLVLFSDAFHYQSQTANLWSAVPGNQPFSYSNLTTTLSLSLLYPWGN